jgi:hypothetical protein
MSDVGVQQKRGRMSDVGGQGRKRKKADCSTECKSKLIYIRDMNVHVSV